MTRAAGKTTPLSVIAAPCPRLTSVVRGRATGIYMPRRGPSCRFADFKAAIEDQSGDPGPHNVHLRSPALVRNRRSSATERGMATIYIPGLGSDSVGRLIVSDASSNTSSVSERASLYGDRILASFSRCSCPVTPPM